MDDSLSRSVVIISTGVPDPDHIGEGNDQRASHRRPHQMVGQNSVIDFGGGVHQPAEENGQQGKEDAHTDDLQQGDGAQVGDALQGKGGGRHTEMLGHPQADDGGENTGHDGGIIEHSHTGDLHRKHGGSQRGAEEGGKSRRHSAHGDDTAVLVVQAHPPAYFGGDRSANLEDGSLPAGGTTHQMGDNGGHKDQGGGTQPEGLVFPHRRQHEVGAPVPLHAAHPVEQHNRQTAHRQQPDQPGIGMAQVCDRGKGIVKGGGHPAAQQAADPREDQPFYKGGRMLQPGRYLLCLHLFHTPSVPGTGGLALSGAEELPYPQVRHT